MRIIYSFLGIIVGFILIRYSIPLTENLGKIDLAEKYLTSGMAGTYSMYRIAGLFIILISLFFLFNIHGFITRPAAPLFGG